LKKVSEFLEEIGAECWEGFFFFFLGDHGEGLRELFALANMRRSRSRRRKRRSSFQTLVSFFCY